MLNLVLFGPPGAGKGTQAEFLIGIYELTHLSTGTLFRHHISNNTELGMEAKAFMDKGMLVPDEVTIAMLQTEVNEHPDAKGFIFDGFPRTVPQAAALDKLLEEKNTPVCMMLSLEVEEEELIKRLLRRGVKSGRSDDRNESVIRNRIAEYNKKTAPLKEYYNAQNKYHSIEGAGLINEISERMCRTIEKNIQEV